MQWIRLLWTRELYRRQRLKVGPMLGMCMPAPTVWTVNVIRHFCLRVKKETAGGPCVFSRKNPRSATAASSVANEMRADLCWASIKRMYSLLPCQSNIKNSMLPFHWSPTNCVTFSQLVKTVHPTHYLTVLCDHNWAWNILVTAHIWLIWFSGTRHAELLRSASASLLSATRCIISFGAWGFRSAAPTIWNSLPSHVRSCETLTTFRRHLKSHIFHSALPTS